MKFTQASWFVSDLDLELRSQKIVVSTIRSGKYPLVTEVYAVMRRDLGANHPARRLRYFL